MIATRTGTLVWVRVGEGGDYEFFDAIDDAVEYLNALNVGKVLAWTASGLATVNFWGRDDVSLYWGDGDGNLESMLLPDERAYVESQLQEAYL